MLPKKTLRKRTHEAVRGKHYQKTGDGQGAAWPKNRIHKTAGEPGDVRERSDGRTANKRLWDPPGKDLEVDNPKIGSFIVDVSTGAGSRGGEQRVLGTGTSYLRSVSRKKRPQKNV